MTRHAIDNLWGMPTSSDSPIRMPYRCPACDKTLYSSAASRPGPSSTLRARLLYLTAGIVVAAIYLTLLIVLREKFSWTTPLGNGWVLVQYPPVKLLSLVALPVALVPGVAIGWIASRIPRVRVVRCWSCRWSQRFPLNAVWASAPSEPAAHRGSTGIQPIVDDSDPWEECKAWAYAEVRQGRLPEDVSEELIGQGWPRDDVEIMVEQCRREARDRRRGEPRVRR